jgi:hypothetical protein
VRNDTTNPTTHQISRTSAVIPGCQDPPDSVAAKLSGRNTERSPSVSQRSGNSEPMACSHGGSSLNTKYTPEMNCMTIAMGATTAPAVRPLRIRPATARPSNVHALTPRTSTQANVGSRLTGGNDTP